MRQNKEIKIVDILLIYLFFVSMKNFCTESAFSSKFSIWPFSRHFGNQTEKYEKSLSFFSPFLTHRNLMSFE